MVEKTCPVCKIQFLVKLSHVSKRECCSRKCKGILHSKLLTGHPNWGGHRYEAGEKHPLWKGDKVSYLSLHQWVYRHLGKAHLCTVCEVKNAKRYEWANISRTYQRNLEDWEQMCQKCHIAYDKDYKGSIKEHYINRKVRI